MYTLLNIGRTNYPSSPSLNPLPSPLNPAKDREIKAEHPFRGQGAFDRYFVGGARKEWFGEKVIPEARV